MVRLDGTPVAVWRHEHDKAFVYELLSPNPDKESLAELYNSSSKGYAQMNKRTWYPTVEGPCPAICIMTHRGEYTDSVFSTIAAFLTRRDRDKVLDCHNRFEDCPFEV